MGTVWNLRLIQVSGPIINLYTSLTRLSVETRSKRAIITTCRVTTSTRYPGLVPEGMYNNPKQALDRSLTWNYSLIAIMLSRLRMTVEDCITEYVNLGGEIFGKPRHFHELIRPLYWINRTKYDARKLVDVINDVTGRRGKRGSGSRFESDADLCRTLVYLILITAVYIDR
jgi:hypothetical protein